MYPFISQDALAGAVELACYFSTVIAVFVSYLLTLRF